jgi:hypothetical protein
MICCQWAQAQFTESIVSERPGQAANHYLVGKQVYQFQGGVDFFDYRMKNTTAGMSYQLYTSQLRIGILEYTELRMEAGYINNYENNYSWWHEDQDDHDKLSDMKIGIKQSLYRNNDKDLYGSVLLNYSLGGADIYENDDNVLESRFIFGYSFTEKLALETNVVLYYDFDYHNLNDFTIFSFGYSLDETWALTLEPYFSLSDTRVGMGTAIAFLPHPDIQLDLYLAYSDYYSSHSLSVLESELIISLGVSFRLYKAR